MKHNVFICSPIIIEIEIYDKGPPSPPSLKNVNFFIYWPILIKFDFFEGGGGKFVRRLGTLNLIVAVEKKGIEVPKKSMGVPRNSLVHRWSQIAIIFEKACKYNFDNKEILSNVSYIMMASFDSSVKESDVFSFALEQLDLLITQKWSSIQ